MAKKLSKRMKAAKAQVEARPYSVDDALALVKNCAKTKFTESVDASFNLGVDPKKSDQVVRGATVLPNGTGKNVRVAVCTQGPNADAAREAGADIVGYEDLTAEIKKGNMDFDVLIASPDTMGLLGRLGPILGPRGLMPNPKVGTVTPDVATAVKNAKAGQVQYRTDKNGIVHCPIGKVSFEPEKLRENLEALATALKKAKPASSKGIYLRKISLSSTMGPGIVVDLTTLSV